MLFIKNLNDLQVLLLLQEKKGILSNPNNVLAYIIDTDNFTCDTALLYQLLDKIDQRRVKEYVKHIDKYRFIISRGILKYFLSFFTKKHSPKDISLSYKRFGKPFMINSNIEFNISHSHNLIIYAFNINKPVGIDIEFLNRNININLMIPYVMTKQELYIYEQLDVLERYTFFYTLWTKKESIIKFIGHGLHYPINTIEAFTKCKKNITLEDKTTLYCNSFKVAPNYLGAITTKYKLNYIAYPSFYNLNDT
jgi:4'-phosphopantetheinyl transferase